MYAIKVNDLIDGKDLVIPFDKVKQLNHRNVEIIILPKDNNFKTNTKGKLEQIFAGYQGVYPYSDITDVVQWQKEIRNEWK